MKAVAVVLAVLVGALVGSLTLRNAIAEDEEKLVIVHWSNSHPMREGLLPEMAAEFNEAEHETASGQPIEIVLVACDSAVQADDLVSRVKGAGKPRTRVQSDAGGSAADPTIVTPQSADWLVDVNHRAGNATSSTLDATESIAETWLGIVTYRAMAECLGWPDVDDRLCRHPGVALPIRTAGRRISPAPSRVGPPAAARLHEPGTSTSGRNVLVSLYSIAAGKAPDRTHGCRHRASGGRRVRQGVPGVSSTTTCRARSPSTRRSSKGTGYGHFFLMPEDNLVSLYKGNEKAIAADGTEQPVEPVDDLVMIYPKEGSVLNSNPAGIVDAQWVTDEEREAARRVDRLPAGRRTATARSWTAASDRPPVARLSVDAASVRRVGARSRPAAGDHRTWRPDPASSNGSSALGAR